MQADLRLWIGIPEYGVVTANGRKTYGCWRKKERKIIKEYKQVVGDVTNIPRSSRADLSRSRAGAGGKETRKRETPNRDHQTNLGGVQI